MILENLDFHFQDLHYILRDNHQVFSNQLSYTLYEQNSGNLWGTVGSGNEVMGVSSGIFSPSSYNIEGKIPAGQNVPIGSYSQINQIVVTYWVLFIWINQKFYIIK